MNFSATATAGAPASIAVSTGKGQNATVGTAVPVDPRVIVQDRANKRVSGASVTFSVTGGSVAANRPELVNVIPACDAFPASVRIVSPLGGVSASDANSLILRFTDANLAALPTGNNGACDGTCMRLGASDNDILRARIRNGAPNN